MVAKSREQLWKEVDERLALEIASKLDELGAEGYFDAIDDSADVDAGTHSKAFEEELLGHVTAASREACENFFVPVV